MCALLPAMRPLVLLCGCLLLSGCGALMGPKNIRGSEGDTVSIQCTYEEKLRNNQKYWCRKTKAFFFSCSDTIYARADGQENTEGRVSIQDSPQELRFNVTLRALTLEDSGEYWCGIRILGFDESHLVSLVVLPGTSGPPTHLDSASAKDTSLFPSSSSSKSRVYSTRIRILAPVLVLLALLLASGLCALGRHILQWRKKDSRESMCSLCRSSYLFQLATETQRNEKDHHSHLAEGGALGTREQEEWGTLALLSGEENLPRGYLLQGPSMAPAERDRPSPREERLQNHEPLGKGQVPEYSMIHVVKSTTRPATSPCTEMQCPDQTSEQEEAPFQDPDGEAVPGPPLHMSEELKRAVFVSV